MNIAVLKTLSPAILTGALYLVSVDHARADDWGCQVILCLSNPGGPTQFAECRPPIEKLWSHLAKGHSFPTCSGAGFSASSPGYEPYYCNAGYSLVSRDGDRGKEATCVSNAPQRVGNDVCHRGDDASNGGLSSGVWVQENGERVCKATIVQAPNRREKPRYIDVTIEGVGAQRVWF